MQRVQWRLMVHAAPSSRNNHLSALKWFKVVEKKNLGTLSQHLTIIGVEMCRIWVKSATAAAIFNRFVWPRWSLFPFDSADFCRSSLRAWPGHSSFWPWSATTLSPGFTMLVSCHSLRLDAFGVSNVYPALAFTKALAITESVPWNDAVRIGTTWAVLFPGARSSYSNGAVPPFCHQLRCRVVSNACYAIVILLQIHRIALKLNWSCQHRTT